MAVVEVVCGMCGGRRVLHVDARWPDGRRAAGKTGPASGTTGRSPRRRNGGSSS